MKKLWRLLVRLAAFLPLVILMIAVNIIVDPAGLFDGGRTATKMAEAVSSGFRVTGSDYDERRFQREISRRLTRVPGALVLGSSRVLQTGSRVTGIADTRNAAVSGAGLLDIFGLTEAYLENRILSREVIIGVDPWMLNAGAGDVRWIPLAREAGAMSARLGLPAPSAMVVLRAKVQKAVTLVSIDYFQQGIRDLVANRGLAPRFALTQLDSNPANTRLPDGTIVRDAELRHRTRYGVIASARAYVAAVPVYQLKDFSQIDAADSLRLAKLVRFLVRRGVSVTLVLPPYHPLVYEALRGDPLYAQVPNAEAVVRAIAASVGARVCGSYDPSVAGLADEDFLDGMHAKSEGMRKLFVNCAAATAPLSKK